MLHQQRVAFYQTTTSFLGFVISLGQVKSDQQKVNAGPDDRKKNSRIFGFVFLPLFHLELQPGRSIPTRPHFTGSQILPVICGLGCLPLSPAQVLLFTYSILSHWHLKCGGTG